MIPPSAHFVHGLEANIAYWQEKMSQLTDTHMHEFIEEQANVILTVELGLALPTTQIAAIELLLLAYSFIERCGYWERWLPLFEKAIVNKLERFPLLFARLLNRQGQLLRLMQQSELAIALHARAEAIAHSVGDQQVLAEIYFNLSVDYWQCRNYEQAEAYGRQALLIFKALPDNQRWQATMLNTLGLICQHQHHLEEAQAHLHQSITFWQQFDEPTELARALNNLANTYYQQGQMEAALHYYRLALDHLAPTESTLDKSEVLINLGALYFKWEQYHKAEIALRQANSPALRHSGNFRLRALLAQNLGNTLLKQQQLTEAEKYLWQSLILWQQLGDDLMQANTWGTLAEAAAQGLPETAVDYYNRALELLDKFPENTWARKLKKDFTTEKATIDNQAKKLAVN